MTSPTNLGEKHKFILYLGEILISPNFGLDQNLNNTITRAKIWLKMTTSPNVDEKIDKSSMDLLYLDEKIASVNLLSVNLHPTNVMNL